MLLPKGIVSVLQTPFDDEDQVDVASLERLIAAAVEAGVDGFLAPVVASEVAFMSEHERAMAVNVIVESVDHRIPVIVGCSADSVHQCRRQARIAEDLGAAAYLVAVPQDLYRNESQVVDYFKAVSDSVALPLIVQDFEFQGPGLGIDRIVELREAIPAMAGIKVETVPAGPKYSAVRAELGDDFYVAGGWAVPQMIEALDRGVDAMIPESSMVRVYKEVDRRYRRGDRRTSIELFQKLAPILAFTNQDVATSIAFFKRLLVHKGIFDSPRMRWPGFEWDRFNLRIAEDLIAQYVGLETTLAGRNHDSSP